MGNTIIVTDTRSAGSGQGVGRMTRTFYDALGRVRATVSNVRLSSRRGLGPGHLELTR